MKDLRAAGLNILAIARALNSEGRSTRLGKPWHSDVVKRILSREADT